MSLTAGLINLSHYSPRGIMHPSTLGIVFGLLSSSSAFLWGAYARRIARDKFLEQGVIEKRTVKVGMPMWVLYPRDALERLRVGVWHGENRLAEVRRLVEEKRIVREAEREREREAMTLETAVTQADAIRVADADLPDNASTDDVVRYLANARPRAWHVSAARVRQVRSAQAKIDAANRRSGIHALPRAHRSAER